MEGPCEHSSGLPNFIKRGEVFENVRNYQLLEEDSAPGS
jgi:hypothetical protein